MTARARSDDRVARTRSGLELRVGRLGEHALAEVAAIERGAYPTPWSLAMFTTELSKPAALHLGAWDSDRLVGYAICSPYDGVWHLLNLAVDANRRRSGIGAALLVELLRRLEENALLASKPPPAVTLEVRRTNGAAQALYRRAGFLEAGIRPRYYPDTGEDALILWRTPATLRGRLDDVPGVSA